MHTFKIEKGKIKNALEHSKGEFAVSLINDDFYKKGEPIEHPVVINYAKKLGILERKGKKWIYGGEVFKKLDEVLLYMYHNPEDFENMKQDVLKAFSPDKLIEGVTDD